ncbi:MAG: peptidylprolyl isomerase [Pseudomonadota bacterium]
MSEAAEWLVCPVGEELMNIAQSCVVTIQYTLRNDAGEVLDTSDGGEPLTYLHGHGGMLPGLERKLEGRAVGETISIELAAEDGYGQPIPELIHDVSLEALAGIANLEVGMQLQSKDDQDQVVTLRVDAISDTHATLNANHPMAGQTLHFTVTVDSVRAATAEELAGVSSG